MNIVEEKLKDCNTSERDIHSSQVNDLKFNGLECQVVRINNDDSSDLTFKRNQPDLTTTITVGNNDASKALAVALNEKMEPDRSWMYNRNNLGQADMILAFAEGVTHFVNHAKTLERCRAC